MDENIQIDKDIENRIDDGVYDYEIVKDVCFYYRKYGDWERLENEARNKIDEIRDWSDIDIHKMLMYIRDKIQKINDGVKGVYNPHDYWFLPDAIGVNNLEQWRYYAMTMRNNHYSSDRINNLYKQCTDIVNFLPDPKKSVSIGGEKSFIKKGLVYGNVQSGKTASICGLIAMYASVGCQFIIVLSGVTNNLRLQTQKRLVNDLRIGLEPNWRPLTPDKDRIINGTETMEAILGGHNIAIGVFKKNPAALKSLIRHCEKISDNAIWNKYQVLIIDDECDQYSPNVKLHDEDTGAQYEHSAINGFIISLMKIFKRVCYVGYTATPFANVLNELPGDETLYPEDFIYCLKKSPQYYGAEKVFGEEDGDDETLDAINFVDDWELKNLKKGVYSSIPCSLKNAINYFIVATACKYKRGMFDKHSSMLLHIDQKTKIHSMLEELVKEYIEYIKGNYETDSSIKDTLKEVWESEKDKNPSDLVCRLFPGVDASDYVVFDYDEITDEVSCVIERLEVIVDNSTKRVEDRLFYDDSKARVCIVIGGNTLSRGLTLEGLIVSYFGRGSKTYDTLLQMGRWFGYRNRYEDLCRLWMPSNLVANFMFLSSVENELRDEIESHAFGMTPKEYAIRVRYNPKLQITRKAAMQNAVISNVSYNGTYAETLFIDRKNKSIIVQNTLATKKFLGSIAGVPIKHNGVYLYDNCDVSSVLDFIQSYSFSTRNRDCKSSSLVDFITKANSKGYLKSWAVTIKSNIADSGQSIELVSGMTFNCISRARVNEGQELDECYIKVHAPKDFMLDIDEETFKKLSDSGVSLNAQFNARKDYYEKCGQDQKGLLVIYPINKNSKPKNPKNTRFCTLEAEENLIGLLFVFPEIKDNDFHQYMQVALPEFQNVNDSEDYL